MHRHMLSCTSHILRWKYKQVSCKLKSEGWSQHMVFTNPEDEERYHALCDITENQFLELIFRACKISTDYSIFLTS